MSAGLIILIIVAILILFGTAQRVLDGLRLNDKQALLFTALIFAGGVIGNINIGDGFAINIGGAIIPIALCVYLFVKAGTNKERLRAAAAAVATGIAVWLLGRFLPNEPETMPIDVNYVYAIAAGIIGYIFGRSRRGAFIAGVMGVVLADIAQAIINRASGINQRLVLGGAGAFDVIVISGVMALLLSELIGEFAERAARYELARGEKRR